jgi:hypothetical protein
MPKKHRAHLETFRALGTPGAPLYGWKFVVNGRVLAQSVDPYSRRRVARRAFRSMAKHIKAGTWTQETPAINGE